MSAASQTLESPDSVARHSLRAALGSAPRRKVHARVLAYRLRYLTECMTELAHEVGDSDANEAGVVCSELLVMRDNVWFMAKRVLPPNDKAHA